MRRLWRRVGPWLTVVLVAVEVVLVWTGVLSLLNAVIIIVVVEALLVVTALGRGIVAVRVFRVGRGEGSDPWTAAEEGLAELVPPSSPGSCSSKRMWMCAMRWIIRWRPPGPTFGYGANLRPIMHIVLGLLVIEGIAVEAVLIAVLGHDNPWMWVALGLHVYALIWIAGFLGSLTVLPHGLGATELVLRDSAFTTVTVPLAGIASVAARHRHNVGRSGFTIEGDTGLLAYGDADVRVVLDSDAAVRVGPGPGPDGLRRIDLTVDDPAAFVRAVTEASTARASRPLHHHPARAHRLRQPHTGRDRCAG